MLYSFFGLEDTMSVEVLVVFIDPIEGLIIDMRVHLGVSLLTINRHLLLNNVEASLQIIYVFITFLNLLDEHFEVLGT